jgi:hypothetical protein
MDNKSKIKTSIKFEINCESTKWGENLFLLGNINQLGNWNYKNAIKMSTNSKIFPLWSSNKFDIHISILGNLIEYKYLILNEKGQVIKWEDFQGNRKLNITCSEFDLMNLNIEEIIIKDNSYGKLSKNEIKVNKNFKYFIFLV